MGSGAQEAVQFNPLDFINTKKIFLYYYILYGANCLPTEILCNTLLTTTDTAFTT